MRYKYIISIALALTILEGNSFALSPSQGDSPAYTLTIDYSYDWASQFHDGYAVVEKGSKYGVIDATGTIVVPVEYEKLGFNWDQYWVHSLKKSDGAHLLCLAAEKDDKWGVVDTSNEIIVPLDYNYIAFTGTSQVIVGVGTPVVSGGAAGAHVDGYYGVYDIEESALVIPVEYKQINYNENNNLYLVFSDKYTYLVKNMVLNSSAVINNQGKIVVPFSTYEIIDMYDNYIEVEKDDLFGILDTSGKTIIPLQYQRIDKFMNGIAFAEKNNKYGIINISGKTVMPFKYVNGGAYSNGIIDLTKDGATTIYDYTGKIVAKAGTYTGIAGICGDLTFVKKDGYIGGIYKNGNIKVPFVYNSIFGRYNKETIVGNGQKKVLIDTAGKTLAVLSDYDNYEIYANGYYWLSKGTESFLYNGSGRLLLQGVTGVDIDDSGYIFASSSSGQSMFDPEGNIIIPSGELSASPTAVGDNNMLAVYNREGKWGYITISSSS